MLDHGKTKDDLVEWLTIFADTAYSDPFPENRRVVISRFIEYPSIKVMNILNLAVEDPDQTVRRKAIEALCLRQGDDSKGILKRIADGKSNPRKLDKLPIDYGVGTWSSTFIPGMDEEEYSDTDQEAARKALEDLSTNTQAPNHK